MLNVCNEQKILNLISSCISQHAARTAPGQKASKVAFWEFFCFRISGSNLGQEVFKGSTRCQCEFLSLSR